MIELSFEQDGKIFKMPIVEVIVLIDPSGFVFEGSMENPLKGVTAVVEEQVNGTWRQWDAAAFGQVNPQVTDEKGRYGWDVIQGDWQVNFSKEGYEPYTSRIVTVPPPETQLNVPLVRSSRPYVSEIIVQNKDHSITLDKSGKVVPINGTFLVEFDRLMNIETVKDSIKIIKRSDGTEVSGELIPNDVMTGYKEIDGNSGYFEEDEMKKLAQSFTFEPARSLTKDTDYEIIIQDDIADYDGKLLDSQESIVFTSEGEKNNIVPDGNHGENPDETPGRR